MANEFTPYKNLAMAIVESAAIEYWYACHPNEKRGYSKMCGSGAPDIVACVRFFESDWFHVLMGNYDVDGDVFMEAIRNRKEPPKSLFQKG